jgi:adenylate kinase family enzyme
MEVKPRKKVFIDSRSQNFMNKLINKLTADDVLLYFDVEISCSDFLLENGKTKSAISRPNYDLFLAEATKECDVFIYDLNTSVPAHLQTHLKILKNFGFLEATKKLILISNVLTWEFSEPLFAAVNEDNEKSITSDLDEKGDAEEEKEEEPVQNEEGNEDDDYNIEQSEEETETKEEEAKKEGDDQVEQTDEIKTPIYFSDKNYLRRMGKGKYLKMIGIENLALNLRKSCPNLTVNILCPGVIYGEEEQDLYELFKISWIQNPEILQIIDKGQNEIPMIHFLDFLTFIKFVTFESTHNKEYIFVNDKNRKRLQKQIIRSIAVGVNKGPVKKTTREACVYEKRVKRLLSLNIKWKFSNIIRDHIKKLIELQEKEEEEKQQVNDEDEENPDEKVKTVSKPLQGRPILDYRLLYENGFVKNIQKVKEEFITNHKLNHIKICIIGGPFSGKTLLAKKLAANYNIPYIQSDSLVEYYISLKNSFSEEILNLLETKKEEELTKQIEEYEKRKKQGKKVPISPPVKEDITVTVPDKILVKMFKLRLNMNDCLNRGYVIDGFPDSYKNACKFYES